MEQVGRCEMSKNKRIEHKRFIDNNKFMNIVHPACYIGEDSGFFRYDVDDYVVAEDFNFDVLNGKYKTIICLEILEHLQNPLWFMLQLKNLMEDDSAIYLSTPNRPRFLYPKYHYNEISAERMQKWLLDPLGLNIARKKKMYVVKSWADYLIGFRPLFRAIKTMNFRPILMSLTNTTWIYEIR